MKVVFEKPVKLQKVITKKGIELWKIEIAPNHFFLEQNPFKNSKYGKAYRMLKEKYPSFYMFWEIENDRYTGRMLLATITDKATMDQVITDLVHSEKFKQLEDVQEEIEPTEG